MIWWQLECKYGDMIRISFGNFYHYGIFVSEDEIIQFGLPPFEGLLNRKNEDIEVCVSDIDTFSRGRIVEVASIEKSKKEKRLSPKKTVKRARACLGEKGYDILHNNCEHFARYCYLGEKKCETTENVINTWKNKTISDVYFYILDDDNLNYWYNETLKYALFRSFGYKLNNLKLVKNDIKCGHIDNYYFSITSMYNIIAVIVSNQETAIYIEENSTFYERLNGDENYKSFLKEILSRQEPIPVDKNELLKLWSNKKCLHIITKQKTFKPRKVCTINQNVSTFQTTLQNKVFTFSVIGNDKTNFKFYSFDGECSTKYKDIKCI